jgi:hypothetical protein
MTSLWFLLSKTWHLQDVQALLSVLLIVLSTVSIFIFACSGPQHASLRSPQHQNTSASLSIVSPDESFSALRDLVSRDVTARRHRQSIFPSLVILCLLAIAILSGPIARFASRSGYIITQVDVAGALASRIYDIMAVSSITLPLAVPQLRDRVLICSIAAGP